MCNPFITVFIFVKYKMLDFTYVKCMEGCIMYGSNIPLLHRYLYVQLLSVAIAGFYRRFITILNKELCTKACIYCTLH